MQTTLLGLNKINTTTVQVNEPIIEASLLEFLFTSTNHSKGDWDVQFLYHYFETSKNYFIASFKSKEKHTILAPQVLQLYFKTAQASAYDLFITSHFFALFSYEKLVCFKPIQKSVIQEEIVRYLEHTFHIKIEHTIIVCDEKLISFENEYLKSEKAFLHNREYSRLKSIKSTMIYAVYCLLLILISFYVYTTTHTVQTTSVIKDKVFVVPEKRVQSESILELMQAINQYNLQLKLFELNHSGVNIKLAHKNKESLMQFVEHQQLKIKSLNYQQESQSYELTATTLFD